MRSDGDFLFLLFLRPLLLFLSHLLRLWLRLRISLLEEIMAIRSGQLMVVVVVVAMMMMMMMMM